MFNRIEQVTARNRALREAASSDKITPQKLTNLTPAQMYGVRYGDAAGNPIVTIVFKIGNAWYMDMKNGQEWANGLSPVAPWLAKQLDSDNAVAEAVKADGTVAPDKDAVDILGDGQ